MLKDPHKSFKLYYSISEVAAQFGVAESLLRYWEKEFPTLRPKTTSRKVRQYTADDIKEVQLIYNLVKVRGMKLSAARETISKNRQGLRCGHCRRTRRHLLGRNGQGRTHPLLQHLFRLCPACL